MRWLAVPVLAVGVLLSACGEDAQQAQDTTACSEFRPLSVTGEIGELAVNSVRLSGDNLRPEEDVGELTSRRITIFLGDVEYTPPGGTPDLRPQILTLQTNVEGRRPLQESIDERRRGFGNEFDVIDKPLDTFCDPEEGELCVRFGLDAAENNELNDGDNPIHTGQSGTVTFETFTAGRIKVLLDVAFGSNIENEFDESEGRLQGCFDVRVGVDGGDRTALEVPCSAEDPREICNQGGQ